MLMRRFVFTTPTTAIIDTTPSLDSLLNRLPSDHEPATINEMQPDLPPLEVLFDMTKFLDPKSVSFVSPSLFSLSLTNDDDVLGPFCSLASLCVRARMTGPAARRLFRENRAGERVIRSVDRDAANRTRRRGADGAQRDGVYSVDYDG